MSRSLALPIVCNILRRIRLLPCAGPCTLAGPGSDSAATRTDRNELSFLETRTRCDTHAAARRATARRPPWPCARIHTKRRPISEC